MHPDRDLRAEFVLGPFQRQLERHLREFVAANPDRVLSLAIRIHASIDDDAGAALIEEMTQREDWQRRAFVGQVARIAYLTAIVWALRHAQNDDAAKMTDDPRMAEIIRAAESLLVDIDADRT